MPDLDPAAVEAHDCTTTHPNQTHGSWERDEAVRLLAEARASLEREREHYVALQDEYTRLTAERDEAVARAERAERELAEAQEQLDYARTRWVPRSDLARAEEER